MPRVISEETAAQVDELTSRGMTQRQIARRLGICLTTVNRIANGGWKPSGQLAAADLDWEVDPATATRCRGCGALVYLWPCLYCEISGEGSEISKRPANIDVPVAAGTA